ncbi:MAG TPA: RluA family pseudouridine synthase [Chloroflexi bacterium]|nr:RluA family pseudouridine synthase [Chloroflexota bacterium]
MPPEIITLTNQKNNQRLDKFLAKAIPAISRSQAKRLIDAGLVQTEALRLKASTPLPSGATLTVTLPAAPSPKPRPQAIPLDILFEDDQLIILNKAAGLVIHPAAGHAQDTLVNALLYHYPKLAGLDNERPGIVHRLDKDTSGVMVVAKTKRALHALQEQFKTRSVEKIYQALVHGHPQAPQGIIDVPLGRHPQHRQQMAPLAGGRPARTHYSLAQQWKDYSLLKLKLETGRTHQIRVHLTWLGYPVVGDTVYGRRKNPLFLSRQFLHASQLSLDHPLSGQRLTFEAPLPPDLKAALGRCA